MSQITRRRFLAGAATAAGAAAFGFGYSAADQPKNSARKGSDVVTLGKSGIKTSMLGLGTGTRGGREQRDMGQEAFTKLVRHALDSGVYYVDTADMYKTHEMVKKALKGVASDKYFVQTKTRAKDPDAAKADIERFRRELAMEQLDTLLVHCMTKGTWTVDMRPVMDVLYDAKEKGRVRAVGVSCHGFDPLQTATGCDWVDVHLVRINPLGAKMDDSPAKVAAEIRKMRDQGRGVLGMKIFGEGACKTPELRLESLKYVLGLNAVDAFTIGFSSTAQIDETLSMIEEASGVIQKAAA
jgi:predicted aldo/keto reductase-like oxidoreductase